MCPNVTTPATKRCSHCKQDKPLIDFSRDKRNKRDGLQAKCKTCARAYRETNRQRILEGKHAYYKANRERILEYQRAYNEANRERILERTRSYLPARRGAWNSARYFARKTQDNQRNRAYRIANKEQLSERRRLRYLEDTKTISERNRRWRNQDPEATSARYRAYAQRRRKSISDNQGSFTAADVLAQYKRQNGRCYYCDMKVGSRYDIDHVIPLSRGGTNSPDNIVIACPPCNRSKRDKLPHEWAQGGRLL